MLSFLVREAALDPQAAYSTFNMGSGYALYCPQGEGERVVAAASALGMPSIVAGRVEEGPRQVILEPVGVRFDGSQLELSSVLTITLDLSLRIGEERQGGRAAFRAAGT